MRATPVFASLILGASLSMTAACDDHGHDHDHPQELITTVALTFAPVGGGTAIVAEFDDPDGDGGDPPTVDPIALTAGAYTLTVAFENRLEDPPEDITLEIADEADEHQVFFTGTAVDGPASDQPAAPLMHAYDDTDANGLPIGLANTINASAGNGDLVVTLRHLPTLNDMAQKTADLAGQVEADGFGAIGGDNDAQVTFTVTVQ
ncbi:MAG TPA: hypothetical protein VML75_04225 [Kofleriaceae bacterium]|nr:hypothetical protein [Kofleriaceae bacterium]